MAGPDPIKARFFQRASDSAWLARVDTQSPLTVAEAELHCAAEYGFPVRAVEVTIPYAAFEALVAQRKIGSVAPPPHPIPPPSRREVLLAKLKASQPLTAPETAEALILALET